MQQGDPLAPLLFSLVIQKLIAAINARCPGLELNLWYMDDGVLGGRIGKFTAKAVRPSHTRWARYPRWTTRR